MQGSVVFLAFVGVLFCATGWDKAALAQNSMSSLPPDIERLVVFEPDRGRMTFYEDGDRRSLVYARARLTATGGFCRNEHVVRTILFRIGSRVALVSEEFWNEPPSEHSRLAEQVAGLLGP